MTHAIVTPQTQALAEGKLTRDELKSLMQRSDEPALRHLALWVLVLAGTTTLITLAWNSWLIWPAMFVQGIVLVHHFSLQHECVHYTVFHSAVPRRDGDAFHSDDRTCGSPDRGEDE